MPDEALRRKTLRLFLLVTVPLIGGSLGYYLIYGDRYSWLDYIYMTVVTISTVGYGEIVDTSGNTAARVLTMVVLIVGMGILLYAVSTLTALIVEGTFQDLWRRRRMQKEMDKLNGHVIICGSGDTGNAIIRELAQTRRPFVVIDQDADVLESLEELRRERPGSALFLKGDATDEAVLTAGGVERAAGLISALREDKDNLFVTITARGLNPKMRIVVRTANLAHKQKFIRAGADAVVSPNFIGGMRIVSEMVRPNAVSFLDAMLGRSDVVYRVEEHTLAENSKLIGTSLKEADIQSKTGCLVLAVRPPGKKDFSFVPDPSTMLESGIVLVVLGDVPGIEKLRAC